MIPTGDLLVGSSRRAPGHPGVGARRSWWSAVVLYIARKDRREEREEREIIDRAFEDTPTDHDPERDA